MLQFKSVRGRSNSQWYNYRQDRRLYSRETAAYMPSREGSADFLNQTENWGDGVAKYFFPLHFVLFLMSKHYIMSTHMEDGFILLNLLIPVLIL